MSFTRVWIENGSKLLPLNFILFYIEAIGLLNYFFSRITSTRDSSNHWRHISVGPWNLVRTLWFSNVNMIECNKHWKILILLSSQSTENPQARSMMIHSVHGFTLSFVDRFTSNRIDSDFQFNLVHLWMWFNRDCLVHLMRCFTVLFGFLWASATFKMEYQ